ncbi:steroid delta-isomerase [Comamonas odontotermitis]|uniref:Steroid delta-isomerase n=1 Tax=Comamonas odontotermitis TaxID=379895 RepID=A0ABR6RLX8_9BURK|nr:nuclear transport factor 2 family protein [Comamonas odontotermitis]MBB6580029.1 steroid delta-isomerase [Comamonas odontotermitis]
MIKDFNFDFNDVDTALNKLVQFYENLTPESLKELDCYYAPEAYFKDPFNEVYGVFAIIRIFEHMFASLREPRFVITQKFIQANKAFIEWEFHFQMRYLGKKDVQCIHGSSFLIFDAQGFVSHHRDYWDAAEELYEKIPIIGILMRWLRRLAST